MIRKNLKRLLVIYFGIIISTLIWNVNHNIFGNPFWPCFILSTTTFLIFYTPFEIYFSFTDFWFDRWTHINLEGLYSKRLKIQIESRKNKKYKALSALLIASNNEDIIKSKNAVVIICHGFSDNKETLQFFYAPLAMRGYIILVYDARGTGGSKKIGKRSQFHERIEDYKTVIEWIKFQDDLKNKKIYSVGFSIGALTTLCGGFPNEDVEKIIAVSSISNYKRNLPKFNPILLLRYFFKGVKLFPNNKENELLSPLIIMSKIKQTLSEKEWKNRAEKILLIHSRNDKVIKLRNFLEISDLLNLSEDKKLILKKRRTY